MNPQGQKPPHPITAWPVRPPDLQPLSRKRVTIAALLFGGGIIAGILAKHFTTASSWLFTLSVALVFASIFVFGRSSRSSPRDIRKLYSSEASNQSLEPTAGRLENYKGEIRK